MLHWFAKRLRYMQEVRRDERGFTLIELLVVVIIIGILAAIAIPVFLQQRTRAQTAECESDARNGASAATGYAADHNGSYTGMTEPILSDEPPNGYDWNYGTNSGTPAVAVGAGGQSYTITITCASGETITFDSTSGSVTRS